MQKTAQQPGGDDQFERSFADLAYAYLKDKVPRLLDFMIGFQVVDKNDDNTRAFGIFGFEVGKKQLLYAPVFFMGGDLKGNQLLYLKDQDMFCPLDEAWVNYMLGRRPVEVGEAEQEDPGKLGLSAPDFEMYRRSPLRGWSKTSSFTEFDPAKADERYGYWGRGTRFDIAPAYSMFTRSVLSEQYTKSAAALDLPKGLVGLGPEAFHVLADCARRFPKMAKALSKFYSGDELMAGFNLKTAELNTNPPSDHVLHQHGLDRGMWCHGCNKLARMTVREVHGIDVKVAALLNQRGIKSWELLDRHLVELTATPAVVKAAVDMNAGVEIITRHDKVPEGLTDDDKTELLEEGMLVRDSRKPDQTSKVYDLDSSAEFDNPTGDGAYRVVSNDGKLHEVIVCQDACTIGNGSVKGYLVIEQDGNGAVLAEATSLFVRSIELAAWHRFYDGLAEASSMKAGENYCIVSPTGRMSVPFTVISRDQDSLMVDPVWLSRIKGRDLDCDFNCGDIVYQNDARELPRQDKQDSDTNKTERSYCSGRPIQLCSTVNEFRNVGDTLFCPLTHRVVKLTKPCRGLSFRPGNVNDIDAILIKRAGLVPLRLQSDGLAIFIQDSPTRFTKVAAQQHLIERHGLVLDAARQLVKRALAKGQDSVWVKYAQNVGGYATSPSVGVLDNINSYDATLGVQENQPQVSDQVVQSMPIGSHQDYRMYDTEPLANQAQRASQTGQKEVFDTAVMSGLTKLVGVHDAIDKYLNDLSVGMDRCGRILVLFYWHHDKFKDRYGDSEMRELEDGLVNTFESLGDVVLFLRKRSMKEDVSMTGTDVDLSDSIA